MLHYQDMKHQLNQQSPLRKLLRFARSSRYGIARGVLYVSLALLGVMMISAVSKDDKAMPPHRRLTNTRGPPNGYPQAPPNGYAQPPNGYGAGARHGAGPAMHQRIPPPANRGHVATNQQQQYQGQGHYQPQQTMREASQTTFKVFIKKINGSGRYQKNTIKYTAQKGAESQKVTFVKEGSMWSNTSGNVTAIRFCRFTERYWTSKSDETFFCALLEMEGESKFGRWNDVVSRMIYLGEIEGYGRSSSLKLIVDRGTRKSRFKNGWKFLQAILEADEGLFKYQGNVKDTNYVDMNKSELRNGFGEEFDRPLVREIMNAFKQENKNKNVKNKKWDVLEVVKTHVAKFLIHHKTGEHEINVKNRINWFVSDLATYPEFHIKGNQKHIPYFYTKRGKSGFIEFIYRDSTRNVTSTYMFNDKGLLCKDNQPVEDMKILLDLERDCLAAAKVIVKGFKIPEEGNDD